MSRIYYVVYQHYHAQARVLRWRRKGESTYKHFVVWQQHDRNWSLVDLLERYLELTARRRSAHSDTCQHLFITLPGYGGGVHSLAEGSIRSITKDWLTAMGIIDPDNPAQQCKLTKVTAHGLRSAAALLLSDNGIRMEVIFRLGGWKNLANFC